MIFKSTMIAHIELPLRDPLERDWDEGEVMELWEKDNKCWKMKLIAAALKGEKKVKVVPVDERVIQ